MGMTRSLRILFTGDFDPDYNRTRILRAGLADLGHRIADLPVQRRSRAVRRELFARSRDCDVLFLPPFTHREVGFVRKAVPDRPLLFDPLISRHMTKVTDYRSAVPWGISALRNHFRDLWSLRAADFVVTDTDAHRQWFHARYRIPLERMAVVPIGNDFREFHPPGVPRAASAPFVVGFYGGFIPLQGTTTILEAARLLLPRTDIRFVLAGTGHEYELAKATVARERLVNVTLPGYVPYDRLCEAIHGFDLALGIFGTTPKSALVVPNKVFHYLACARPVVTRDSPAMRELFVHDEHLCLVPPDARALAQAIEQLVADPGRCARLASAGHDRVARDFDHVAIGRMLVACFERAIACHGRR